MGTARGVKRSRSLSVCSTYGPEIVCLYSCAYEMFRSFSARVDKEEKKDYLIYCIV